MMELASTMKVLPVEFPENFKELRISDITELGRHIEASAKSSVFLNFLLGIGNVLLGATQLNADGGALTQVF